MGACDSLAARLISALCAQETEAHKHTKTHTDKHTHKQIYTLTQVHTQTHTSCATGACESLAALLISALCARETEVRMLRMSLLVVRTFESVWMQLLRFNFEANTLLLNSLHMLRAGCD
jgi:hypothetical protein